ncbi:MAG: hypothetical protein AVDCRST_MAG67-3884, partial [uncultured Solirubrobacteraceae bacterium]
VSNDRRPATTIRHTRRTRCRGRRATTRADPQRPARGGRPGRPRDPAPRRVHGYVRWTERRIDV